MHDIGCGIGFLGILIAQLQLSASKNDFEQTDGQNLGSIWLTDCDAGVLSKCKENIFLPCSESVPISEKTTPICAQDNLQHHPHIKLCLLDWFEALDTENSDRLRSLLDEIDPEIIVGADLVGAPEFFIASTLIRYSQIYDPSIIPALVAFLVLSLRPSTYKTYKRRKAIIALTVRNENSIDLFIKAAGMFYSSSATLLFNKLISEMSLDVRENFTSENLYMSNLLFPLENNVVTRVFEITAREIT